MLAKSAFNPSSSRVYLDLDGVFADFAAFVLMWCGQPYESMPPSVAWGKLERVPHLFSKLELLPGSPRLYHALAHYGDQLAMLTALPMATGHLHEAPRDKRAWVALHIAPELKVLTSSSGVEKAKMARPGDVLVDDCERNVLLWRQAGGLGVVHRNVPDTLAELRQLGVIS